MFVLVWDYRTYRWVYKALVKKRKFLQCMQVVQDTAVGNVAVADLRAENSQFQVVFRRLLQYAVQFPAGESGPTLRRSTNAVRELPVCGSRRDISSPFRFLPARELSTSTKGMHNWQRISLPLDSILFEYNIQIKKPFADYLK